MLSPNLWHPAYDFEMELLTMIPKEPHAVPLQDMADDFGMEGQKQIVAAVKHLAKRGFEVFTLHYRGSRSVSIRRSGWTRSASAADQYWHTVYG